MDQNSHGSKRIDCSDRLDMHKNILNTGGRSDA